MCRYGGCLILVSLVLGLQISRCGSTGFYDVVLSSDTKQLMGLIACANSIIKFASMPARLRISIIGLPDMKTSLLSAMKCIDKKSAVLNLVIIDQQNFPALYNMESDTFANFVRFYAADLLPDSKCILWADADVVFKDDVVGFMKTLFKGEHSSKIVAVSLRPWVFSRAELPVSVLTQLDFKQEIYNFTFFNAGVIFINGVKWREKRMTEYQEEIQKVFIKVGYVGYRGRTTKRTSQTPMVMLAYKYGLQPIERRWGQADLGWDSRISRRKLNRSAVLHWSGKRKPWLKNGLYRSLWIKYGGFKGNDSRCPNIFISSSF